MPMPELHTAPALSRLCGIFYFCMFFICLQMESLLKILLEIDFTFAHRLNSQKRFWDNCHWDICSCNIWPGDNCSHQECFLLSKLNSIIRRFHRTVGPHFSTIDPPFLCSSWSKLKLGLQTKCEHLNLCQTSPPTNHWKLSEGFGV